MTLKVDHRECEEMKKLVQHYIIEYAPQANQEISLDRAFERVELERVRFCQLAVGDYVDPEHGLGVERKSDDFIPEIMGGALFQKLTELAQYPHSFLVVDKPLEEILSDLKTRLKRQERPKEDYERQRVAIMGAVSSISLQGFPPLFFSNREECAEFIIRTYYKAKDGKDRSIRTAVRPKSTHEDRAINVLLSFPYVGENTAKKLVEHYDDLEEIFEGLKELYAHPDKELMRKLGLNKRNLEQAVALLVGGLR